MPNYQWAIDDDLSGQRSQFAEAHEPIRLLARLSLEGFGVQSVPCRWEVPAPRGADWGIPDGNGHVHHQEYEEFESPQFIGEAQAAVPVQKCEDYLKV